MAEVTGEIEKSEDRVLVVRRIHVKYVLRADPGERERVDRVLAFHASKCPVARTIGGSVDITTELELVPETA